MSLSSSENSTSQHDRVNRAQRLLDFRDCDFPKLSLEDKNRWNGELGSGNFDNLYRYWLVLRKVLRALQQAKPWSVSLKAYLSLSMRNGTFVAETKYSSFRQIQEPDRRAILTLMDVADRLAVCQNQSCKCVFLRTKRQTYCSPRCRDTVNKRAYRKRKQSSTRR